MIAVTRSGCASAKPKPHGRAVVEDVNRVAFETDRLGEGVDDLGQVFKRIAEPFAVGRIREAESWEIRRDHMVAVGQGQE